MIGNQIEHTHTYIRIPKRETYDAKATGLWWAYKYGTYGPVLIHCPKGHRMGEIGEEHKISIDGKVSPSIKCIGAIIQHCMAKECDYHIFGVLDGWQLEPTEVKAYAVDTEVGRALATIDDDEAQWQAGWMGDGGYTPPKEKTLGRELEPKKEGLQKPAAFTGYSYPFQDDCDEMPSNLSKHDEERPRIIVTAKRQCLYLPCSKPPLPGSDFCSDTCRIKNKNHKEVLDKYQLIRCQRKGCYNTASGTDGEYCSSGCQVYDNETAKIKRNLTPGSVCKYGNCMHNPLGDDGFCSNDCEAKYMADLQKDLDKASREAPGGGTVVVVRPNVGYVTCRFGSCREQATTGAYCSEGCKLADEIQTKANAKRTPHERASGMVKCKRPECKVQIVEGSSVDGLCSQFCRAYPNGLNNPPVTTKTWPERKKCKRTECNCSSDNPDGYCSAYCRGHVAFKPVDSPFQACKKAGCRQNAVYEDGFCSYVCRNEVYNKTATTSRRICSWYKCREWVEGPGEFCSEGCEVAQKDQRARWAREEAARQAKYCRYGSCVHSPRKDNVFCSDECELAYGKSKALKGEPDFSNTNKLCSRSGCSKTAVLDGIYCGWNCKIQSGVAAAKVWNSPYAGQKCKKSGCDKIPTANDGYCSIAHRNEDQPATSSDHGSYGYAVGWYGGGDYRYGGYTYQKETKPELICANPACNVKTGANPYCSTACQDAAVAFRKAPAKVYGWSKPEPEPEKTEAKAK